METIQMSLFDYFMDDEQFTLQEATDLVKDVKEMNVNHESIRARIYEGIEAGIFKRVSRGVYKVESQIKGKSNTCLLINGDGRDLSFLEDNSIDGIITDHPYDLASLKGGNRKFAQYELFKYTEQDFQEKMRVLKQGSFCVEFLPEENEDNYKYLYSIKEMASEAGFKYFSKVAWKKGDFVANTGRKSKNVEDVLIFSKGDPRSLKLFAKKNLDVAKENGLDVKGKSSYDVRDMLEQRGLPVAYMKGTAGMLPTNFDHQPKSSKQKIHEAEKPVELLEEIIQYISLPNEILLDQFAGSGNFAIACANMNRNSIVIEKDERTFETMKNNIESALEGKSVEIESEDSIIVKPLTEQHARDVELMDEDSGNDVGQWVEDNEDYAWGMFLEGELIGYCTVGGADDCPDMIESYKGYDDDSLLLSDVYIKPEYRGNGYASLMVQDVLEQRNPNREETVFIMLLYDDLSRFYEKQGFHWVDSSKAYCMVKDSKELLREKMKEREREL